MVDRLKVIFITANYIDSTAPPEAVFDTVYSSKP